MFKILDELSYSKKKKSLKRSDFNEAYNNYMIQRWLSMYNDTNVEILNETVNYLYSVLTNEQNYMLMHKIIPPQYVKGKYIKADKNEKEENKVKDKDTEPKLENSAIFEESARKLNESLAYVNGESDING